MTEYTDLSVCDNKWKMFMFGYYFDKSEYNVLFYTTLNLITHPTTIIMNIVQAQSKTTMCQIIFYSLPMARRCRWSRRKVFEAYGL